MFSQGEQSTDDINSHTNGHTIERRTIDLVSRLEALQQELCVMRGAMYSLDQKIGNLVNHQTFMFSEIDHINKRLEENPGLITAEDGRIVDGILIEDMVISQSTTEDEDRIRPVT